MIGLMYLAPGMAQASTAYGRLSRASVRVEHDHMFHERIALHNVTATHIVGPNVDAGDEICRAARCPDHDAHVPRQILNELSELFDVHIKTLIGDLGSAV